MKKLIGLLFLLPISIFAVEDCLEISEQQFEEWKAIKPRTPGVALLLKAKKIVDVEKDYSLQLGTDKTAHCYLGCRISEDVTFEVAKFSAWQKEYNDATDCNSNTYFDISDYEATLVGAEYGAQVNPRIRNQCASYCKTVFNKLN